MRYFISVFLLILVSPQFQTFKNCGSKSGTIYDVSVTGCVDDICNFTRNESINVKLAFMPLTYVKSVTMTLNATFQFPYGDVHVRLMNENGCDCCLDCPLDEFKNVTMDKQISVPEQFPSNSTALLEWKLIDNMNYTLVCLEYFAYIN